MTARPTPWTDEDRLTHPTEAQRAHFGDAFERLVGIMARLRGEDGCPWDRAQDLASLKPYLVEEAYEVLEAIDGGDPKAHEEELGDLLLQVVFQAEVRRQEGAFDAAHVAHAIADKLVRRHPHVFGQGTADTPEAVTVSWAAIKAQEKRDKGGDTSALAGVPRALPALLRAQRVGEKAARVGFDWPDVGGPLAKVAEEVAELQKAIEAGDEAAIAHELGDALFSLVNVARAVGVGAEEALGAAVERFSRRFRAIEAGAAAEGRAVSALSLDEMEAYWQAAKRAEGQGKIS
jgi:MazG family protein